MCYKHFGFPTVSTVPLCTSCFSFGDSLVGCGIISSKSEGMAPGEELGVGMQGLTVESVGMGDTGQLRNIQEPLSGTLRR